MLWVDPKFSNVKHDAKKMHACIPKKKSLILFFLISMNKKNTMTINKLKKKKQYKKG
jgi:hypothetical protein